MARERGHDGVLAVRVAAEELFLRPGTGYDDALATLWRGDEALPRDDRHTAKGKRSGLFTKSKKKWQQPLSKKYLAWAWGIGRSSMDDYAEARSETAL